MNSQTIFETKKYRNIQIRCSGVEDEVSGLLMIPPIGCRGSDGCYYRRPSAEPTDLADRHSKTFLLQCRATFLAPSSCISLETDSVLVTREGRM